jgi:hypothetical protein
MINESTIRDCCAANCRGLQGSFLYMTHCAGFTSEGIAMFNSSAPMGAFFYSTVVTTLSASNMTSLIAEEAGPPGDPAQGIESHKGRSIVPRWRV